VPDLESRSVDKSYFDDFRAMDTRQARARLSMAANTMGIRCEVGWQRSHMSPGSCRLVVSTLRKPGFWGIRDHNPVIDRGCFQMAAQYGADDERVYEPADLRQAYTGSNGCRGRRGAQAGRPDHHRGRDRDGASSAGDIRKDRCWVRCTGEHVAGRNAGHIARSGDWPAEFRPGLDGPNPIRSTGCPCGPRGFAR
jgi:hypothetical protein